MNILDLNKKLEIIEDLKSKNNYNKHTLKQLQELPTFNGICELHYNKIPFFMINISNDDAVVLKYLWKNKYESLSLSLWFNMTRKEGVFFDIGVPKDYYKFCDWHTINK